MSDTPRTDAAEFKRDLEGNPWVKSDFARELERELGRVTAERDEARRSACAFKARYLESIDGFPLPTDDEIGIKTRAIARRMGWDCFHATEGER